MSVNVDVTRDLVTEQQKITAEIRELDLLIESTRTEITRLKARKDQTKARVDTLRGNSGNVDRDALLGATDEHTGAPSPRLAMVSRASRSASIPSAFAIVASRSINSSRVILRSANFWTRERIVAGTFCISVVANMNAT